MQNIYLVGFMGAGKSVVGQAVARRLGRGFVDLDAVIEARLGMPIREIFATSGEAAFRTAETEELRRTTEVDDLVVATGGGAFSLVENRGLIEQSKGISVYLDVAWDAIRRRLERDTDDRPKWLDDEQARQLFEQRRADYLRATIRVELGGAETPDEVAARIVGELTETACAS